MTVAAYIEEYSGLTQFHGGLVQLPSSPIAVQKVAVDVTSTQSAAFSATTRFIKLTARGTMVYLTGSNPTAADDGTSRYIPNGVPIFLEVTPSQKIALIQVT